MSLMLSLHVYLAAVVRAACNTLDSELLDGDFPADNLTKGIDCSIHRTVSCCGGFEFLT